MFFGLLLHFLISDLENRLAEGSGARSRPEGPSLRNLSSPALAIIEALSVHNLAGGMNTLSPKRDLKASLRAELAETPPERQTFPTPVSSDARQTFPSRDDTAALWKDAQISATGTSPPLFLIFSTVQRTAVLRPLKLNSTSGLPFIGTGSGHERGSPPDASLSTSGPPG